MRALTVGTAGHVDHGKTTLVRALTGVETDRWEEERRRGLTIDLGFAPLPLEGFEAGIVDVPGHEDFVKNMLAGSTGIDLLLLAVAADEGPMPQTREHLSIAALLGVTRGVVALTAIDRAEPEWCELAAEAAREEVRRVVGAEWPLVQVSAPASIGVERLRSVLREAAATVPERRADDWFRLPVDRAFSLPGAGTVVTGTVWSGSVARDASLRILPGGYEVRVRSLQVHGEDRRRVGAGRRCAAALVGVDPDQTPRGSVVVGAGEPWRAVERLGVRLRRLPHAGREIADGQRVRLYLGTRETMARVELPAGALQKGGRAPAVLHCESPVVCRAGDRFVLRFYSPVATIGGGLVAELDPPRRWAARTGSWGRILAGDAAEAVEATARLAGPRGLPVAEVPLASGAAAPAAAEAARGLPRHGDRLFHPEVASACGRALTEWLHDAHAERPRLSALPLETLRASLGERWHPDLVEGALTRAAAAGTISVEGPRVRLADHRPRLTAEEGEALASVVETLEAAGWDPPAPPELARRLDLEPGLCSDLLRLLEERGEIVSVSSDVHLTARWEAELRRRAAAVVAARAPAPPAAFAADLGLSRRALIPLLEYLDAVGTTRRTGRGRVPG